MYKKIEPVKLERGCIVWRHYYCAQHTGVYLGEGKIAQIGKPGWFQGNIEKVSVEKFLDGEKKIYTFVYDDDSVIKDKKFAEFAEHIIDNKIRTKFFYLPWGDNCHRFTISCMVGRLQEEQSAFWDIEERIERDYRGKKRGYINSYKNFANGKSIVPGFI